MILFIGGPVDWEGGSIDWRAWETWMGDIGYHGRGCVSLESERKGKEMIGCVSLESGIFVADNGLESEVV